MIDCEQDDIRYKFVFVGTLLFKNLPNQLFSGERGGEGHSCITPPITTPDFGVIRFAFPCSFELITFRLNLNQRSVCVIEMRVGGVFKLNAPLLGS